MRRPKVTHRPGGPGEAIVEFAGLRGIGGLISIVQRGDRVEIDLYRLSPGVHVTAIGHVQPGTLSKRPPKSPIVTSDECSHFIANADDTFTCETCWTPAERESTADEDVQVWEVGSTGWTGPISCHRCKRPIDVVIDTEEESF